MRDFQSVWYRLVLLFLAIVLTVGWFVLGPSNPGYAVEWSQVHSSSDP